MAGRPTTRDSAFAVKKALTRMLNNGTRIRLTKGQVAHIRKQVKG